LSKGCGARRLRAAPSHEFGTDQADLRFQDPRSHPERIDEVIELSRRQLVHVGPHHDREQRPVDATPTLEDLREERTSSQLWDPQLDVASVTSSGLFLLCVARSVPIDFYFVSALAGLENGLGFATMTNLVVAAVPYSQTGIAAVMNSNFRSTGGAFGTAISTSLLADELPANHGNFHTFILSTEMLFAAGMAALTLPAARAQRLPSPSAAAVGDAVAAS
jgi:hypothetical protein